MSNKNRRKKQNHDEVFMQIRNNQNGEEYMLKVPENYKHVLNVLMIGTEYTDYHNSQEMLQFFCELFSKLDHKERCDIEVLLNSKVEKTNTISDLVELLLGRYKYYCLYGVDSYEKLGRFHIIAARNNHINEEIANCTFDQSAQIGKTIKFREQGRFYKGIYVGRYHTLLEGNADD